MQFGTVSLIGRTNVGKSTFLNRALGQALAITSPLPQTTRDALIGVAQHKQAQIAFVDTPGLHRPRTELGKRMNYAAVDALRGADLIVCMTDVWEKAPSALAKSAWTGQSTAQESPWIRPGDQDVLAALAAISAPVILVVNKVDRVRDKKIGRAHV